MNPTVFEYPAGDITCRGEYYLPENASGLLPVVLVVHAWDGLLDEVRNKAVSLATEAGYIAFAVDVYGNGKTYDDKSQLSAALTPYLEDRGLLTRRMEAAAAAARTIPGADTSRVGAMGYCFGGTAVLDLARADSSNIKATVAFHAGLEGNSLDNPASIRSKILVCHGEDDPLVPPKLVAAFKAEMTTKKADWQLHAYGHTVHAFTRPAAKDPASGAAFNEAANRRSWQAMLNFFAQEL